MSKFTSEMVDNYADKLLIGLTSEENKIVLDEFDIINESMETINSFPNLNDVEPMTHALSDFSFIPRDDIKKDSPKVHELLQNCSKKEEREVVVPRVVG